MAETKMDIEKRKVITPSGIVSYPAIFEPKAFEDGPLRYSMALIFDCPFDEFFTDPDYKPLRLAVQNATKEKWGPSKSEWPSFEHPTFRDGNEKTEKNGKTVDPVYKDKTFITAWNDAKPGLCDHLVRPIIKQSDFYPGCLARMEVIAFAYQKGKKCGVSFSLLNVQKISDGVPLGGRLPPEKVFSKVSNGSDDEDEEDGDDDIYG